MNLHLKRRTLDRLRGERWARAELAKADAGSPMWRALQGAADREDDDDVVIEADLGAIEAGLVNQNEPELAEVPPTQAPFDWCRFHEDFRLQRKRERARIAAENKVKTKEALKILTCRLGALASIAVLLGLVAYHEDQRKTHSALRSETVQKERVAAVRGGVGTSQAAVAR